MAQELIWMRGVQLETSCRSRLQRNHGNHDTTKFNGKEKEKLKMPVDKQGT